ncbi:MAG: transcriptional regulator NrdR [Pyrinomonadaceae bacterium]
MRCPFCAHIEDKVVDSREAKDGDSIRRRRECFGCGRRFTSYERIDEIPYMAVKKDGKREMFERGKILSGLLRASEKRPISVSQLEYIVDEVEKTVQDSTDRELATTEIGKIIMARLKSLDKVAYVRFASVYLEFEDVSAFMTELKDLVRSRDAHTPPKKPKKIKKS